MNDNALDLVFLAEELEAYIKAVVPGSHTVNKYGGTLFTLKPDEKEGQFCGLFVYKQHVQVSFSRGAELKDPKRILLGTGSRRRHINFKSMGDVDEKELQVLLVQASELSL